MAILVCVALLLRAFLIAQAPFTDEGSYIAVAFHWWNHEPGSPAPISHIPYIHLYPGVLCWLLRFAGNGFVHFRVADAIAMACCASVLYLLLARLANTSVALGLSLLWVFCFNHPLFINAGFKNPFAPGFICIILAWLVAMRESFHHRFFAAGALLGVSALFREPFAVFLLPVLAYAIARSGIMQAVKTMVGFAVCVAVGVVCIVLAQGAEILPSISAMLRNYQESSVMYRTLVAVDGIDLRAHAMAQLRSSFDVVGWALPIWLAGLLLAVYRVWRRASERPALVAGILLILVPLPEFFLKLGFPYHLTATFLGFSFLAAIGFHCLRVSRLAVAGLTLISAAAVVLPGTNARSSLINWWLGFRLAYRESRYFAPVMLHNDWSSPAVRDSFYLDTAARIMYHSRPEDRILVSGYYAALYPLSNRRPVSLAMTDLSSFLMSRNRQIGTEERQILNAALPAVFVETNRFSKLDLRSCFDRFDERFRQVDAVEVGKRHYGQFACRIWKSRDIP